MTSNLASNIEHIKREKDGLDVLSDIYIYAVLGEKVTPEDLIRFKWYGIHAQDKKDNLFKIRIPLSLGLLELSQLKLISKILNEFKNSKMSLTNNQKIEINNLKLYDIPNIFSLLESVNLNTTFESGDTVRNVATCAVSGVENDEIIDVNEIANKLNETFKGSKLFSNLPNRLKISITGCSKNCITHGNQDINFKAIKNNKDKALFKTEICGHYIGVVTPSQVVPLARATAKVYRDYGDREDILNKSFQNLVNSWGIDKFFDILDSSINFRIKKIEIEEKYNETTEHIGIYKSKTKSKNYIGYKLNSLKLENLDIENLITLLEKYEIEKIKIASMGILVFLEVLEKHSSTFLEEFRKLSL